MEFLAESYLEAADPETDARLAAAAAVGSSPNAPVRHLRTILIPEDETLLVLYEAPSADAVREALASAGITFDRISEASTHPRGTTPAGRREVA
jgi:hypothetical protein